MYECLKMPSFEVSGYKHYYIHEICVVWVVCVCVWGCNGTSFLSLMYIYLYIYYIYILKGVGVGVPRYYFLI